MIILRLILNLAVFLIPAALAARLSARLARTSRNVWRLFAWAPVVPLALWAVFIAWGVSHDPTSHNLWPFELIIWCLLSCVLLLLFVVGRRVFSR